jgi:hypothetical protein
LSVARALGNDFVLSLFVYRQRTLFAELPSQAVETGAVTDPQIIDTDINLKLKTTIRRVAHRRHRGWFGKTQLLVD